MERRSGVELNKLKMSKILAHTHTHMKGINRVSQSRSLEEMVKETVKIWLQQPSCQLEATVSGSKVPPLTDSSGDPGHARDLTTSFFLSNTVIPAACK